MTKKNLIGTKEQRLKRIGGSEFATVLDINPYKKRIELVLEKAGVIADTFEGNEATRRGQALENDIIAMFEDETGLSVYGEQEECSFELKDDSCLPLVCHLDGITSDNAVFEAKTTDINSKTWKNGIPEYYKAQLDFNCRLANLEKAYIAVGICRGVEIIDFQYFEYTPKLRLDEIVQECLDFSNEVEKFKSYGNINNGKVIKSDFDDNLIEELETLNEKISEIKAQAKVYEDRKKYIEDKIKKEIQNNAGFETDLFKVTLGQRITSPVTDYRISRSGIKIEYKEQE